MPLYNPVSHPLFRLFETSGGTWTYGAGATSTLAGSDGQMRAYAQILPRGTLIELDVETTAAGASGSLTRLGIYRDSLTRPGYPGALFYDAGTVATDTAAGVKSIAVSNLAVPMDLYWLVAVPQGAVTAPTYRSATEMWLPVGGYGENTSGTTKRAWIQTSVSAGLPSNFTTTLNSGGGAIRVLPKFA